MGKFRSKFCCSRTDASDDEAKPARPVEIPQTGALSGVASVTSTPSIAVEDKPDKRDLWKEAFEKLDAKHQTYLCVDGASSLDATNEVISTTRESYTNWKKKGLKFHRANGDEVKLRDLAERILGAAMQFQNMIKAGAACDPTGYAWGVVSAGLTVATNSIERRDAIFEAPEYLADTLAYHTWIEESHAGRNENLDQALVRIYKAILEYTAELKKAEKENLMSRAFESFIPIAEQQLQKLKQALQEESSTVEKWANATQARLARELAAAQLARIDDLLDISKDMQSRALSAEEDKQLVWISSAVYSDLNSDLKRKLQKRRSGETGSWLLHTKQYEDWKHTPGNILWLPGVVGCGKSVLCSTVVQDIEEYCEASSSRIMAYWFFQFDRDETHSVESLVRSFIRQLSRPPLSSSLTKAWKTHHTQGSQPSWKSVLDIFHDVLSRASGEIFLILDAMDECPETPSSSERLSLLKLLLDIHERYKDKVHIIATSRRETDIERKLERFPVIDLEAKLAEDVETFVHASIADSSLSDLKPEIKRSIVVELLRVQERRRFRWADLQIERLKQCRTDEAIKQALRTIPQTLEQTYQRILENAGAADKPLARGILMFLCFSPVPLDLKTIADAFDLNRPSHVIEICSTSLVNEFEGKVRLAHFSVREFLVVAEDGPLYYQFSEIVGHLYLAEKALSRILTQERILTQAAAMEQHFLVYAARYFHFHVIAVGDRIPRDLLNDVMTIFIDDNHYLNWTRIAEYHTRVSPWVMVRQEFGPPIHRASRLGLFHVVDALLTRGEDPSVRFEKDDRFKPSNAFMDAAEYGHVDVLGRLLNTNYSVCEETTRFILAELRHNAGEKYDLIDILEVLREKGDLCDRLKDPGDIIKQQMIDHTLRNSGVMVQHILTIFLGWRPKTSPVSTDSTFFDLVTSMFLRTGFEDMMDILLARKTITTSPTDPEGVYHQTNAEVVQELTSKLPINRTTISAFVAIGDWELMEFVLGSHPDIRLSTETLTTSFRFAHGVDMMKILLSWRHPDTAVDMGVIMAAQSNPKCTPEDLRFLWEQLSPTPGLNEEVLRDILFNQNHRLLLIKLALIRQSPGITLSDDLAASICAGEQNEAMDIIHLLINNNMTIPITKPVMCAAASNWTEGPMLIELLAQIHSRPLPATDEVFSTAANNPSSGLEILRVLKRVSSGNAIPDEAFLGACSNPAMMSWLLDQRSSDLPLEEMIEPIANIPEIAIPILQILIDRKLIGPDQWLVEKLSGSVPILEFFLLAWNPEFSMTEKVLLRAAAHNDSMNFILDMHHEALQITERVITQAVLWIKPVATLERLLRCCESTAITKDVILTALSCGYLDKVDLLLKQRPDIDFSHLWDGFWQSTDETARDRFKNALRLGKLDDPDSTSGLLQTYPDLLPPDCDLDDFVKKIMDYLVNSISNEKPGAIIIERCNYWTCDRFLEFSQLPITDELLQAGSRNRTSTKDLVVLLLTEGAEVAGLEVRKRGLENPSPITRW
ncbi:unnamed protein product [Penicillium salamii]|uniref:NACHT domain-containing protein n=1 Tax=Penicillium salamii TaxID=1612424 RepID=A0A9W4JK71_9EURO|nr:unnamed protein product [Penicillium salamii]CAG8141106.1 unnamed protein product [Penicillium salamii]CAG8155193.1 unnamed protein product [Penicillium salamii]CAG8158043.1 unnamed protein product [Penicillium salamii]CAG8160170.1 unnamed protein product [Penicillium salamii]